MESNQADCKQLYSLHRDLAPSSQTTDSVIIIFSQILLVLVLDGALDKLKEHVGQRIPNDVKFEIPLVTVEYVQKSLQSLDITKAVGLNWPPGCSISYLSPVIYHSLTIIIYKSIQYSGTVPDIWKLDKLIPIHKSSTLLDGVISDQ